VFEVELENWLGQFCFLERKCGSLHKSVRLMISVNNVVNANARKKI
jgi:hypothetical protein